LEIDKGGGAEMISRPFEYFAPKTLGEALDLMKRYGDDAKILAGGQSLVPMMNLGLVAPRYIIDLNKIRELSIIRETSKALIIGAMVRHHVIASSENVRRVTPMLCEAASHIGDMHVRHRGTIGGSVCHADPAADYLPVLLVADAVFEVRDTRRKRLVKAREFFKDAFTTALKNGEILTTVQIPKRNGFCGAYEKLEFVAGGYAVASAAVMVKLNERSEIENLMVGIGGVERRPMFLDLTSSFAGRPVGRDLAEEVEASVTSRVRDPISDIHADVEYRKAMAGVLARRAFQRCVG
jgi:carbon-monoxide dehydrogenase medium subunit